MTAIRRFLPPVAAAIMSLGLHVAVGGVMLAWSSVADIAPSLPPMKAWIHRLPPTLVGASSEQSAVERHPSSDSQVISKNASSLGHPAVEPPQLPLAPVAAKGEPIPASAHAGHLAQHGHSEVATPSHQANTETGQAQLQPQISHSPIPATAPPRYDAAYLHNPKAPYPMMSHRLGEEGRVLLAVFVGQDGRPHKVRIEVSSGFERLDNAALETVAKWSFSPARRGDEMVADWISVPILFRLDD